MKFSTSSSLILAMVVVLAPSLSTAQFMWGNPQPAPTPAPSVLSTEAPTGTPVPSVLATETPTGTPEPSVLSTETPTGTPEPSVLSTEAPTETPEPSSAQIMWDSPKPTSTPAPSVLSTGTPSGTPEPSVLSTGNPSGTPEPSDSGSETPEPSVLSTETPTETSAPVCEENVFDCVFSCATPEVRATYLEAFNEVAADYSFEFVNERDQAAFFGMVKHNTQCLSVCESDINNDLYKEPCTWDCSVEPVEGQSYYPRGPMMLAYACNYADMQKVTNITDVDLLSSPDSLCSSMYNYWASAIYVWQRKEGDSPVWGTSCQEFSSNDQFGRCLQRYNQADCTIAGRENKYNRQLAVLEAAKCFGGQADFTVAQMTCMVDEIETPLSCAQQQANGGIAGDDRSTTSPWVDGDINQLAADNDDIQSSANSISLAAATAATGFAALLLA